MGRDFMKLVSSSSVHFEPNINDVLTRIACKISQLGKVCPRKVWVERPLWLVQFIAVIVFVVVLQHVNPG